jgi:hypothetical protein
MISDIKRFRYGASLHRAARDWHSFGVWLMRFRLTRRFGCRLCDAAFEVSQKGWRIAQETVTQDERL